MSDPRRASLPGIFLSHGDGSQNSLFCMMRILVMSEIDSATMLTANTAISAPTESNILNSF